jgi:glycosyltransferase involved in cell wall biosynthesis
MTGAAADDQNILKHLTLLGVKVDVILPEGRSLVTRDEDSGSVTIHKVRIPSQAILVRDVARMYGISRTVLKLHREGKLDLLRVHSFFSSCLETLCMKAVCNLPVPAVLHFYHLDTNPWRNFVVRSAMRHCNAVIAISQASKQDLVTHLGVDPAKIRVVYLGIERRFRPAPPNMHLLRQLGCSPEEQILLFLGTLEPRKNPLMLLDVLKDLLAAKRKVKLIIAGTGPLKDALQRKVELLGLQNNVVLTGVVSDDAKPDYYNLSDVFLFPSALEGFGIVLGEAMSCGRPVVAFNASAIPEVVSDGVTGFLAQPGDKDELVRKTMMLLDNRELRLQMGAQATERVDRLFRWEQLAKETLDVYQQTVARFRAENAIVTSEFEKNLSQQN